jgi:hypothetical protein
MPGQPVRHDELSHCSNKGQLQPGRRPSSFGAADGADRFVMFQWRLFGKGRDNNHWGYQRFLNALAEAEDYLIVHPAEAKAIVKRWLAYDEAHIASIWPKHHFTLSFEQALVIAMKDQIR